MELSNSIGRYMYVFLKDRTVLCVNQGTYIFMFLGVQFVQFMFLGVNPSNNVFFSQCDVVANSVGTKSAVTENVLSRGVIAQQFGRRGGRGLVNEVASAQHACWTYGEIKFTDSHGLNTGGDSPKKIVHFCVPKTYGGDSTYLVSGK